jgi:hypothetical protein
MSDTLKRAADFLTEPSAFNEQDVNQLVYDLENELKDEQIKREHQLQAMAKAHDA